MPVGSDAVTVRHFQANGVVPRGSGRGSLDYCELRARSDERRRRTPRNCAWGECVRVMSAGMCSYREQVACNAQRPNDHQGDEQLSFHKISSEILDGASSRETEGFSMQRLSPLNIFSISSQVLDFYWIMRPRDLHGAFKAEYRRSGSRPGTLRAAAIRTPDQDREEAHGVADLPAGAS